VQVRYPSMTSKPVPTTVAPIQTTLYDLIATLQDETHNDDELITATIAYYLQSGQIQFLGDADAVRQMAVA
jgi:hypothetical protein